MTARLNKDDFTEVIERFPDLCGKLKQHSRRYQDNLKKQLKEAMTRTSYIEKLSEDIIEEMVYTLKKEQFENGNVIHPLLLLIAVRDALCAGPSR